MGEVINLRRRRNVRTPFTPEERNAFIGWINCLSDKLPPIEERSWASVNHEFEDAIERVRRMHAQPARLHAAAACAIAYWSDKKIRGDHHHMAEVQFAVKCAFFVGGFNVYQLGWECRKAALEVEV